MGGEVVHAVKGNRQKYQPLNAKFSTTADPVEITLRLKNEFGFNEMYIADLDAIMGREGNISLIERLSVITNMRVMVDAGVNSPAKAVALSDAGVFGIIIGTETLEQLEDLTLTVKAIEGVPVIGSIDILHQRVLSKCPELNGVRPLAAAKLFADSGVDQLILLDMSRVGSEMGVDLSIVKETQKAVELPLLIGGGVTSMGDILALKDSGASGVLVATVLYNKKICPKDLDLVRGGR